MRSQIEAIQVAPADRRRPKRFAMPPAAANTHATEETLVADARAAMRPAAVVEDKLRRLLANTSIGASHLQN